MSVPETIGLAEGGILELHRAWFDPGESARLFERLRDELPWAERTIRIAGREILQPRLTAWIGDPEARYTYSGLSLDPAPWTPCLSELRAVAETAAHLPAGAMNSVLANLYRTERDSMGMHADAERELGPNPVIVSMSFGAPRRFVLAYAKKDRVLPKVELELGPGSLLVMRGTLQHFWKHGVPKEKRPIGPRINLTFRRISTPPR